MKLYHYTSEKGFQGIALNKILRLTQSTQSNDEKDTIHIHNLINEKIEDFYINEDIRENRVIEIILKIFNNFEKERFIEGEGEKSEKAYVICFTTKADNRLLWTSYSNDEGYCIGIDLEKFKNYINTPLIQENIFKVVNTFFMNGIIYDKESQKSLIKDIIQTEYNRLSDMPNDVISENIPTIVFPYQLVLKDEKNNIIFKGEKKAFHIRIRKKFEYMVKIIVEQLLFISPILKNDYWEDEGETRLIFYRPVVSKNLSNVEIDEKHRNYIEFTITSDVIKEVIIAPMNPKTIEEVQQELIDAGYDISKIQVRYSKGKGVLRERGK